MQSLMTDYSREPKDAVRKNRQANPMLLAPGAGINRNRQRIRTEGGEEQRETLSAASALRNRCKQMVKRAEQRGLGDLRDAVENPIDAYNFSKVGLAVSWLAAASRTVHVCPHSSDIGELAKGGLQTVDARMAIVWPVRATELDDLTKCLSAFQDASTSWTRLRFSPSPRSSPTKSPAFSSPTSLATSRSSPAA